MRADPFTEAVKEIADGLGRRNDIERWRQCAFVIKVTKPKFGTSEFPLFIFMILQYKKC